MNKTILVVSVLAIATLGGCAYHRYGYYDHYYGDGYRGSYYGNGYYSHRYDGDGYYNRRYRDRDGRYDYDGYR